MQAATAKCKVISLNVNMPVISQIQSTSLITPLLTMPFKGMNNALSGGMQSSIVHTLRSHGKQRHYK